LRDCKFIKLLRFPNVRRRFFAMEFATDAILLTLAEPHGRTMYEQMSLGFIIFTQVLQLHCMTIIIDKNASAADVEKQIKKASKKKAKGFDAVRHAGKVRWEQDPLAYQHEVRGE